MPGDQPGSRGGSALCACSEDRQRHGTAEELGQPGQGELCSSLPVVSSQCVRAPLRDGSRSSVVQRSALLLPASLPVLLPQEPLTLKADAVFKEVNVLTLVFKLKLLTRLQQHFHLCSLQRVACI